jgi:S1-C subfamily serine protease
MLIRLRIRPRADGPFEDREFTLDALRIGRAPSADLVIPDDAAQTISWQHARIDSSADGIVLHDLKSTNGTYLNGRRVEGPERLRVGDRIQLGQTGPTLEVVVLEMHNGIASPPPVPARIDPTYIQHAPAPPPMPAARRAVATPPGRPAQMSATRAMLIGMQKKQKVWMYAGGSALLVAGLVIGIVLWRHESRIDSLEEEVAKINARFLDEETDADAVDSGKDSIDQATRDKYAQTHSLDDKVKSGRASGEVIYQRTVLSTVWVITDRLDGTGSVIEHDGKRLIVTSYHVVDGAKRFAVIYPKFMNGKVLANYAQYLRNDPGSGDSVACNIWAADPGVDLAVLEPVAMPEMIRPLPLASASVGPAADVFTVGGNPNGTSALWSYTRGSVRQVTGPVDIARPGGQKVHATIVETQNPVNHGDSGGPLVNKKCELVGVTYGEVDTANLVARFIDIGHVREVLSKRPQFPTVKPDSPNPPPSKPPMPKPPTKKDPVIPPKTGPKQPDSHTAAGHVYCLMMLDDTDQKIGRGVAANGQKMRALLESGLPQGRLTIEEVKGKQFTPDAVRDYFRRLRATPADTVMVYYAGHGCGEHRTHAHYFSMRGTDGKGQRMPRAEVLNLAQMAGGRLSLLISDCCSSWVDPPLGPKPGTTAFAGGKVMEPLLLRQHGVVDITGASPGEYGWYGPSGGVFTKFLHQNLASGKFNDWDRIYKETTEQTVEDSKTWMRKLNEANKIGQTQQTPFRFDDMNARRD